MVAVASIQYNGTSLFHSSYQMIPLSPLSPLRHTESVYAAVLSPHCQCHRSPFSRFDQYRDPFTTT